MLGGMGNLLCFRLGRADVAEYDDRSGRFTLAVVDGRNGILE